MPGKKCRLSALEHFILSCHHSLEGINVAALTLYLDDSGTHLNSPVAVAAVWISPVKRWKRFEGEWEAIKSEYGFNCFHTSEFMAGNPSSVFATWPEAKKVRLLRRIEQLCMQRTAQGFGVGVLKKDYEELVPETLKQQIGRSHYTWAISQVLGLFERWREGRNEEATEFILDYISTKGADADKRREIDSLFDSLANVPDAVKRYGIYKGCHAFKDRHHITPLQLSDFLAWSVFQRALSSATGKTPSHSETIKIWDSLVRTGKVYASLANRSQLKKLVDDMGSNTTRCREPYIIPHGSFPFQVKETGARP